MANFKHGLIQARMGLLLTIWEMTNVLRCDRGRDFNVYYK